jgi:hypothetical protein
LPDGSVVCRLRLKIGGEWITKVDVGGPSEQPDGGDRLKAAFSDALKRAAVKFGIGRYLYRLPQQWVDYDDPQNRMFSKDPTLPAFARHFKDPTSAAPPRPTLKSVTHALPSSGAELQKRLQDYEAKLVAHGLCGRGELLKHVSEAGVKAGHDADLTRWVGPAITLAVEETKTFEALARKRLSEKKEVA